jgi:hypothetical protein
MLGETLLFMLMVLGERWLHSVAIFLLLGAVLYIIDSPGGLLRVRRFLEKINTFLPDKAMA